MTLPIFSDPHFLSGLLDDVKTKALDVLAQNAPVRSYVSVGEPAYDCDQLTVHLSTIRASHVLNTQQSSPRGSKEFVSVAVIVLTVVKCVSVLTNQGEIPTDESLDADGKRLTDIAQALWIGLLGASVDGTLFPEQVRPAVTWRGIEPVGPQANLAGWKVIWEVSLT